MGMHQKGTSFVGQALHPHLTSMLRGVSGTVLRHACRVEGPGALGAVPGLRWIQRNPSGCEDVPMGHKDSDLNAHTCNASLLRRKELHHLSHLDLLVDGRPTPIREVLQRGLRVLVGLPNRGKVCSEQHLPGFVAAAGELAASGVQLPVLSVSQGEPEAVSSWAEGLGLDPGTVLQVVDRGGRLTRFLGMEHPEAGANVAAGGPAMLRWTALVEDGVLLRLFVEESAADVNKTSAAMVLQELRTMREVQQGS